MSENVAQTVQKVIQDLVAPDLRELKTIVAANQKQIDLRFDAADHKFTGVDDKFIGLQKQIDQRFDSQRQIDDAQFRAILAAIAEGKAQSELNTVQAISALSERVAILESRHQ